MDGLTGFKGWCCLPILCVSFETKKNDDGTLGLSYRRFDLGAAPEQMRIFTRGGWDVCERWISWISFFSSLFFKKKRRKKKKPWWIEPTVSNTIYSKIRRIRRPLGVSYEISDIANGNFRVSEKLFGTNIVIIRGRFRRRIETGKLEHAFQVKKDVRVLFLRAGNRRGRRRSKLIENVVCIVNIGVWRR